ncbi:MAG TPA: PIN domain-containing protein [Ignavibacteria bacterium]
MKILLDTNIIIHREASKVINQDIGQLFNWIDNLHYYKYIHPLTVDELKKHLNKETVETIQIKLQSYNILKTLSPVDDIILNIIDNIDKSLNDKNDTLLINELYNKRVDVLITEDKNIHRKATLLNISDRVFNINNFLENILSAHPSLVDYKVLSIKKEYFGNINVKDEFFNSFRLSYKGFDEWFNKKADEIAYICQYDGKLRGFLFLKVEDEKENYIDIEPVFTRKKRLKIGTLKTNLFGVKLGERFLKIIFDNALTQKVDEIYFTIFNDSTDKKGLINLMESYGFNYYGIKSTESGKEEVYVRNFSKVFDFSNPKLTFPYITDKTKIHYICIYPEYHTELFPDSILKTESPNDFVENEPHRNAISKVYISHSIDRNLNPSDIIIFYRTGGIFEGVVTTIGIVESVKDNIKNERDLIRLCRGKTVLSESELKKFWDWNPKFKPFIINFLYAYSFPKRPNLKVLIDNGIIASPTSMPRGIFEISKEDFIKILKLSNTDENIIVH